jgi:acyl-CoA synthetase (AMP-forming)/AMP-acid ligase II
VTALAAVLRANRASHRAALVAPTDVRSYSELADEITRFALELRRRGARPGHRLAIITHDGAVLLRALLGGLEAGLTVSVVSAQLGPVARHTRIARFDPDYRVEGDGAITETRGTLRRRCEQPPRVVLWTSGSSGLPRGVVFDLEALLWNARANAAALGIRENDRSLVLLDSAYCYALVHQVLTHLVVGASVLFAPNPSWVGAPSFGAAAREATTTALVPALLHGLLAHGRSAPLAGVRQLTVGGAAFPEALLAPTRAAFPRAEIIVTYGMTEAGPRITRGHVLRPGASFEPGVVGRPLDGVEVHLVEGELVVRSPSLRMGELVDDLIVPSPPILHTGDLVELLSDGAIRWLARGDHSHVNRGGAKVLCGEIARVLESHPGVLAACVVPGRHPSHSDRPIALVVPTDPARPPSATILAQRCARALGSSWVPAAIEFVDGLPPRGGAKSVQDVQP